MNEHNLVLVDCVVQRRRGGRVVRRRHGIVEVQVCEGEDSLKTQKRTGVFYSKTSSPSNTSMFPFFFPLYTRTACPRRLLSPSSQLSLVLAPSSILARRW